MKNELQRHKKSDKIKWIVTAVALFLVAVSIVGMGLQIFGNGKQKPSEWFKQADKEVEQPVDNDRTDNGGMVVTPDTANNRLHVAAALTSATESDISEQSENIYTLTAHIEPAIGIIPPLTWSTAWVNAESDWANEKAVSDYVAVTAVDGTTATVECLQAFGERVTVTVEVEGDSNLKATCFVDYKQRLASIKTTFTSSATGSFSPAFNYNQSRLTSSLKFRNQYFRANFFTQSANAPYFKLARVVPTLSKIYTIPLSGSMTCSYSLKLSEAFYEKIMSNLTPVRGDYKSALFYGISSPATYFKNYIDADMTGVDLISSIGNSYFYFSDYFGIVFPSLRFNMSDLTDSIVIPNSYTYAATGFLAYLHYFTSDETIASEDKFNFYVKFEASYGDETISQTSKLYIDYVLPVDSVSLNTSTVIF